MEEVKTPLGKLEEVKPSDLPKLQVMIRELILTVQSDDEFKRADRTANLICEALGVEDEN
jgi:hypothetical protein